MADEPTNPQDEINDDVRSAIASLKGEAPETPEAPEPEIVQAPAGDAATVVAQPEAKGDHPTDPNRYSDGTFKPSKTDAAPAKAAAPDPKLPPTEDVAKVSAPQPSTAALAPPVSWAAEAKQAWTTASPAIQAAAIKREQEVSAGFKQYSDQVRRYETAINPIAQAAQRRGIPVEEGIQRLAAAQEALDKDPRGTIAMLAQSYGVDLAELVNNPPAPQQQRTEPVHAPADPRVDFLLQRIQEMDTHQNLSVVEAFAAANPHYAKVEDQLPALMSELKAVNPHMTGQPLLQAAYDRAVWLNPEVRAELISAQQQQATQAKVQQVAAKSAQAAKAAVSVKGSSSAAAAPLKPAAPTGNDVYDDVRNAMAQLREA